MELEGLRFYVLIRPGVCTLLFSLWDSSHECPPRAWVSVTEPVHIVVRGTAHARHRFHLHRKPFLCTVLAWLTLMKPVVMETNLPRVSAVAVLYSMRENVSEIQDYPRSHSSFKVSSDFSETKSTNLSVFSLVLTFLLHRKALMNWLSWVLSIEQLHFFFCHCQGVTEETLVASVIL